MKKVNHERHLFGVIVMCYFLSLLNYVTLKSDFQMTDVGITVNVCYNLDS